MFRSTFFAVQVIQKVTATDWSKNYFYEHDTVPDSFRDQSLGIALSSTLSLCREDQQSALGFLFNTGEFTEKLKTVTKYSLIHWDSFLKLYSSVYKRLVGYAPSDLNIFKQVVLKVIDSEALLANDGGVSIRHYENARDLFDFFDRFYQVYMQDTGFDNPRRHLDEDVNVFTFLLFRVFMFLGDTDMKLQTTAHGNPYTLELKHLKEFVESPNFSKTIQSLNSIVGQDLIDRIVDEVGHPKNELFRRKIVSLASAARTDEDRFDRIFDGIITLFKDKCQMPSCPVGQTPDLIH